MPIWRGERRKEVVQATVVSGERERERERKKEQVEKQKHTRLKKNKIVNLKRKHK